MRARKWGPAVSGVRDAVGSLRRLRQSCPPTLTGEAGPTQVLPQRHRRRKLSPANASAREAVLQLAQVAWDANATSQAAGFSERPSVPLPGGTDARSARASERGASRRPRPRRP